MPRVPSLIVPSRTSITFNEEKIKVDVIVPLLKDMGIDSSQIEYETNFKIRLGTNEGIEIPHFSNIKSGRSDILCRAGEQNYFIVEVKSESVGITQEDVDQGISYARLLHPIAPYVIITNGKKTKIVHSITKEEVQGRPTTGQAVVDGLNFDVSLSDAIESRYEALKYFVGYSRPNIVLFSHNHLETRMAPVKGSLSEIGKKYIPELCHVDTDLITHFQDFLTSDKLVFPIIGESGVGKTNAICSIADQFVHNHIVLFFCGSALYNGLFSTIASDFNWIFSESLQIQQVIRRTVALLTDDSFMLLLVDAVDEIDSKVFLPEFDDLLQKFSMISNRIKVCITCKNTQWPSFLKYMGNPTFLSNQIYASTPDKSKTDVLARDRSFLEGVSLDRFSGTTAREVIERYRKVFNFSGDVSPELLRECRLGIMLRIVAEVYENRKLPRSISDDELFRKYLEKKFEKLDPAKARGTLTAAAKVLIDPIGAGSGEYYHRTHIKEDDLKSELGLRPSDTLSSELFSHSLLESHEDKKGVSHVGFYYNKIRDYIIAIQLLDLPNLNEQAFRQALDRLFSSAAGQSALGWYLRIAEDKHYRVFLEQYTTRALLFITEYSSMIDEYFPSLKKKILPYTDGEIGIVMEEIQESGYAGYSLRQNQTDQPVIVFKREEYREAVDPFIKYGGYWAHYGGKDFLSSNPKEAAAHELMRNMDNVIILGNLNEYHCVPICKEIVNSIISYYSKELTGGQVPYSGNLPILGNALPINLGEIIFNARLTYAKFYAQEVVSYYKELRNEWVESSSGGRHMSFSISDFEEIDDIAHSMVLSNDDIDKSISWADAPPFDVLLEILNKQVYEDGVITESLLPEPDIPRERVNWDQLKEAGEDRSGPHILAQRYSNDQFLRFVHIYYDLFFKSYVEIVEANFGQLASRLPFYSRMPFHLYVGIFTRTNNTRYIRTGYHYGMDEQKLVVKLNPGEDFIENQLTKADSQSRFEADYLFWPSECFPIGEARDSDYVGRLCLIRTQVYKRIKDEIGCIYGAMH